MKISEKQSWHRFYDLIFTIFIFSLIIKVFFAQVWIAYNTRPTAVKRRTRTVRWDVTGHTTRVACGITLLPSILVVFRRATATYISIQRSCTIPTSIATIVSSRASTRYSCILSSTSVIIITNARRVTLYARTAISTSCGYSTSTCLAGLADFVATRDLGIVSYPIANIW